MIFEYQKRIFDEAISRLEVLEIKPYRKDCKAIKVNVWRNHAIEPIINLTEPYLNFSGLKAEFILSDYDDSLTFDKHDFANAELLWLDLENFYIDDKSELILWLKSRVAYLRQITDAPILILLSFVPEKIKELQTYFEGISDAYVLDITGHELLENLNVRDDRLLAVTGTRISHKFHLQLAQLLGGAWLYSLIYPPLKAVVVDLDLTLYNGVLGEDGIDGIVINSEYKMLHHQLKKLKNDGYFLAIASKNDRYDVDQLLASDKINFTIDDFDVIKAGWGEKKQAIVEIASELRIGLDSILFIDDNPGELMSVTSALPGLKVLYAQKNPQVTLSCLKAYPGLYKFSVKSEDVFRSSDLKANSEREKEIASANTPEEYFSSLEIALRLDFNNKSTFPRLSELSKKTNQFNLSFGRLMELEIEKLLSNGHEIVAISLKDRFSDSGIIGLMILKEVDKKIIVSELCVSCRALGRKIEDDMLFNALVNSKALMSGQADVVVFKYKRGDRNQPCLDWLKNHAEAEDCIDENNTDYYVPVGSVRNGVKKHMSAVKIAIKLEGEDV